MFKYNTPFDPSRFKFFYGWLIAPVALLGLISSLPGQTAGFSAFKEPLCNSLRISGTTLATAYLLGTTLSGFLLPYAGRLLDRYGTRKAIFVVYFCFGIVLFSFSKCEAILQFLLNIFSFMNREFVSIVVLAILVFGIRFFGQGMLPVISNTMVARWFDLKRGKVLAFMGVLNSLIFNASPLIMSFMIGLYGWQSTWLKLAFIMGIGFVLFSWIFYRDNPEECGLTVDGITLTDKEKTARKEIIGMTVKEATATVNFQVVTAALCLYGMVITGFTFNIEAIGLESGLDKKQAMGFLIPVSLVSIPVGFSTAWFSNIFSKKSLVLVQLACQIFAYIALCFIHTKIGSTLAIISLGLAGGMFGPIYTITFAWFFGRKHLGAINGKATSFMVLTSALGPVFFELTKDIFGSYRPAFFLSAILPLVILLYGTKMRVGELYKQQPKNNDEK